MVLMRLRLLISIITLCGAQLQEPRNHKRRNLGGGDRFSRDDGKFDPEKDKPCLMSDGTVVVPNEILDGNFGGGGGGIVGGGGTIGGGNDRRHRYRRYLQEGENNNDDDPWSTSPWADCEEIGDDDDDSNADTTGNATFPTQTPLSGESGPVYVPAPAPTAPSEVLAPIVLPVPIPTPTTDAPTLKPTLEPTRRPTPKPTTSTPTESPVTEDPVTESPTNSPTRSPSNPPLLPNEFYYADTRNTIYCQISVALPPHYRRRGLRELEDRGLHKDDGSRITSSSDDEGGGGGGKKHMGLLTAKRFKKVVGSVVENVIMNATKYKVVEGPPTLRRDLQYISTTDYDVPEGGVLIVISRASTNVTRVKGDDIIEPNGIRWWLYTIVMHTIEQGEAFANIEKEVMMVTDNAIVSGEFFNRLQKEFSRLVAVSRPGEEMKAIMPPIYDDRFGESGSPVDGIDVRVWDASRWVGLGLFGATILITMALTRTATQRRKKVQEQEDWGVGLATENGINQLLTYGWEYDGATNQVHAFDKSKLVYRDDDSMLIGGAYPLQHPPEGAPTEAVTSSHNTSERSPTDGTPSSRSHSSRDPSSVISDPLSGRQSSMISSKSSEMSSSEVGGQQPSMGEF